MEAKNEKNQKSKKTVTSQKNKITPTLEAVSDKFFPSEMNDLRWSVISFEECESTNLTYDEAVQKLQKLAANDVSGLCVVTNEAAHKVKNRK